MIVLLVALMTESQAMKAHKQCDLTYPWHSKELIECHKKINLQFLTKKV